jgi:DNA-binding IclR family transcriptional regulator
MLKSLIAETLVMQEATTRRYFLGPAMFRFGLAAALRFDLRALCEPLLDALARDTGDTVFLSVRNGSDAVCVDRKEGASPIKIFTLNIGDRRPLGVGAGGLAMLGAMSPKATRNIIHENAARLASYGELDTNALLRQTARARKLGYALHKVRNYEGVKALGMAIADATGQPVAAISLSTLSARLGGERLEEVLKLIRSRVRTIEAMLAKQPKAG